MVAPTGRDTLILTVNQRLARYLLFKHNENQKNRGKSAWETPQIFELRSWLKSRWLDSNPDYFILSEIQSIKIWESIIKKFSANDQTKSITKHAKEWKLLNSYSAAKQASNAYRIIKEYRLSITSNPLLLNTENNIFLEWINKYQDFMIKIKAVDPADLIDVVHQRMKENLISIPKLIQLKGFEENTPQLIAWLDFLKSNKVNVIENNFKKEIKLPEQINIKNKNIQIHSFTDLKGESRNCANWIRSIYRKGKSIGIIVPELDKYRQTLHKDIFTNLIPQAIFPWEKKETPFDISIGTPLSNENMIQVALDIISISIHKIPINKILHIINNPYIKCGRTSWINRNRYEAKLKEKNMPTLDFEFIKSFHNTEKWPELNELINHVTKLSSLKGVKLPSFWANTFSEFLKNIGWVADSDKTISSREIQCLNTWNECLDDLASLDTLTQKLSRTNAINELKQITSNKLFQVKTKEQPIQILSLQDSIGLTFDNLWIMGCHSDCMPAQPNPNPFIPIHLQKKNQLPHCDSKYELQFSEQTLSRLLESSNSIIFSYPEWEKGINKQLSSLLDYLSIPMTEFPLLNSFRVRDKIKPLDKIELWQDKTYIKPTLNEIKRFTVNGLRAGYKVIKNQADCPFQAFAAHRLQADITDQSNIDYDTRERGILIHKILQLFWEKHKTLDKLRILKNSNSLINELKKTTSTVIKQSSQWLAKQPYFSRIEHDRTLSLLSNWMEQELLRSDFTVKHTEKNESIVINKLKLNLRIDRIDIDPEGRSIIIDYKTGSINTNDWFANRIQDPQLPLYSTHYLPDGIAFAQISKDSLGWHSAYNDKVKSFFSQDANVRTPSNLPKHNGKQDWEGSLNFWKNQLASLADEFLQGKLIINPIKKGLTCKNCDYKMLCRIGDNTSKDNDSEILG